MKKIATCVFLAICSVSFGQMEVGSVWKVTGTTAAGLENLGLDSTKIHFLTGGVFEITYIQNSTPKTETSTWHDLTPNSVTVSYDPNGTGFGMMCPTDTTTFTYSIASNVMTLSNIQGTCTAATSILNNSQWTKVITSTAGLDETTFSGKIYPNPAESILVIAFENELDNTSFQLTNALGQEQELHVQQNEQGICVLDISSYAPGMYFIRFNSGKTAQIIVE